MTRYQCIAVRQTPQEDIHRSLTDYCRKKGLKSLDHRGAGARDELRAFEISPARGPWILVFPEDPHSCRDHASHLSRELDASVLWLDVEVGESLSTELFINGQSTRSDEMPGPSPALLELIPTDEGKAQVREILSRPTQWEDYYRVAEAVGLESIRDYEHMQDALMDQEEAGYRRLVMRKAAGLGVLHRLKHLFEKPDLSGRH